jgi:hypothetical protein
MVMMVVMMMMMMMVLLTLDNSTSSYMLTSNYVHYNRPIVFLLLFIPVFQHKRPFFGTFISF